jgi:ATP-binding protein involved in chromosome partitioning
MRPDVPGVPAQATQATHVLAVTSGKGGVGKSTISLNLALALAEQGCRVGLLDADLYGPDIPVMVGLTRTAPLRTWDVARAAGYRPLRLEPVERFGIRLMSVGLLLGERQALALPEPLLQPILRQLLVDVAWGELDWLVVDLPPGTADVQQLLLRQLRPSGALVVVGPQDVAHLDAKRVLDLLATLEVRVLGGVENLAELACPHCGTQIQVFPPVRADRSIWSLGVRRLARVPTDPTIARASDSGQPVLVADPGGQPAAVFRKLASAVLTALAQD